MPCIGRAAQQFGHHHHHFTVSCHRCCLLHCAVSKRGVGIKSMIPQRSMPPAAPRTLALPAVSQPVTGGSTTRVPPCCSSKASRKRLYNPRTILLRRCFFHLLTGVPPIPLVLYRRKKWPSSSTQSGRFHKYHSFRLRPDTDPVNSIITLWWMLEAVALAPTMKCTRLGVSTPTCRLPL